MRAIRRFFLHLIIYIGAASVTSTAHAEDLPTQVDTLVVASDGTGSYRTLAEALESCRAFMTVRQVIFVKNGIYKEKTVIPSWLTNIEICGEDREHTIITFDDHANICRPLFDGGEAQPLTTFRTYTLRIDGSDIILRNITIENNAPLLGQAVALHTVGTRLQFINCRLLGNQDTVFTGMAGTLVYFKDCYIEGTTDFIFGSSTALFEDCHIHSKKNSFVTAASTPADQVCGYLFHRCRLTAEEHVKRVYLGRPWRPYASTVFMECELGGHIRPEGWNNWRNPENEKTARYAEYGNTGPGADVSARVEWSRQLTREEALAELHQFLELFQFVTH